MAVHRNGFDLAYRSLPLRRVTQIPYVCFRNKALRWIKDQCLGRGPMAGGINSDYHVVIA